MYVCVIVYLWDTNGSVLVTQNLVRTNEMPDEPVPATMWIIPKLLAQLQEAKMWPVKLRNIKHQDALSPLANYSSETCYMFVLNRHARI